MSRAMETLGLALLNVVPVLARVTLFPAQVLEEGVEGRGNKGAEQRADPVDPVVGWEARVNDGGAEGTRRVEGATGEVDAYTSIPLAISVPLPWYLGR